jgi:hypothetical protein
MVKITIDIDGQKVKLSFKELGKYNMNGAMLLKVSIDAIRALGVELDEDFIEDFFTLSEPDEIEEAGKG